MRLLVYSQGTGLGHLQRTRTVARTLTTNQADWDALIVADSASAPFFAPVPGIDYVKLPTIERTGASLWQPGTMGMSTGELLAIRQRVLMSLFDEFRPDCVLVDHRPVGLLGELKPVLDAVSRSDRKPRMVLGLRDILDTPEAVAQQWNAIGAYDYLEAYDDVLIYGDPAVYDAGREYELDLRVRSLQHVGYVVGEGGGPEDVDGSLPSQPYVLVIGGGGHDAYRVQADFLRSFPKVARITGFGAFVVTGPNMSEKDRADLDRLAVEAGSATVVSQTHQMKRLLDHAEAVITMGGYNSLVEILTTGKKALVAPRIGSSKEQLMRATVFDQRGYVTALHPEVQSNPGALGDTLLDLLERPNPLDRAEIPDLQGASRAAAIVAA